MPSCQRRVVRLVLPLALFVSACGDDSCCGMCGGAAQAGMVCGTGGVSGSAGTGGMQVSPDAGPVVTLDSCKPDGPFADALGSARTVIFTGGRALQAVTSSRQGLIVYDEQSGIFRVDTSSAAFERIAPALTEEVLVADLNVYWVQLDAPNLRSIRRASLSATDATPDPVAENLMQSIDLLRFDQTNLYFADRDGSAVWRLPIAGGAPTMLLGDAVVQGMEVHAGYLYYTDTNSSQIYRVKLDDGAIEVLSTGENAALQGVEADAAHVYWASDRQVFRAALGDPVSAEALGQGGPGAGGPGRIQRVMLLDDRLYWSDDLGNLGFTAADGSSCGLVVKGLTGLLGWDVDETSVYLTTVLSQGGSELWKIAR